MNHGVSGWHTAQAKFSSGAGAKVEPIVPTQWENMLRELAVTDEEAIELLEAKIDERGFAAGTVTKLRAFVELHCLTRFIPEAALRSLGLGERVEKHVAVRAARL